ncbi:hypothetical protein BJX66DRAFT_292307 [Aspergillus keveii]|uniref:Secreted protein n=1 Tax=Aspergillus keveii TaxID=714993 RepID=A0ABR4GM18_9EURO
MTFFSLSFLLFLSFVFELFTNSLFIPLPFEDEGPRLYHRLDWLGLFTSQTHFFCICYAILRETTWTTVASPMLDGTTEGFWYSYSGNWQPLRNLEMRRSRQTNITTYIQFNMQHV